jgi:hypothetical protein
VSSVFLYRKLVITFLVHLYEFSPDLHKLQDLNVNVERFLPTYNNQGACSVHGVLNEVANGSRDLVPAVDVADLQVVPPVRGPVCMMGEEARVLEWRVDQVRAWLEGEGAGHLKYLICDMNRIDGRALLMLQVRVDKNQGIVLSLENNIHLVSPPLDLLPTLSNNNNDFPLLRYVDIYS